MKFLGLAFIVLSIVHVNSSQACSYWIDENKVSAELEKVVTAGIERNYTVTSSSKKSFKFFESKPTPMCPEEMTYEAVYIVNYDDSFSGDHCQVELSITKVEPFVSEADTATYTVSGMKTAVCTK